MGRESMRLIGRLSSPKGRVDSEILDEMAQAGIRVFHLKGDGITNKDQFLKQIAAVMHFPSYFGHNWDALDDCLTDLAWVDDQELVLVYEGTGHFAETSPKEWATAAEILKEAEDYWAREGPPRLHLVLKE